MQISLILAADENNAIGLNNDLPWPKMSADLKRFKSLTLGHHVIMGRKTHESMGGELMGRKNIVVSRSTNYTLPESIEVVESLAEGLKYAADHGETEAFVIGGAMLFKEAVHHADIFYLTRIHNRFDADTWLPALNMDEWEITEQQDFEADEKNPYPYSFLVLKKVKKADHEALKV
jgi:dihydrofolate reductase